MVFRKNDLYATTIRYNKESGEIFFLKLEYDGGNTTLSINKNSYHVSVDDYELGDFDLINKNVDNSNFLQQIDKILNELGNSVNLEYIKALSEVRINGKEIKIDNNKMINLVDKLFHTTLSYIRENFSSYHFPLNFNKISINYTYIFRNPSLNSYLAYTHEYIYAVTYAPVQSLTIYKRLNDNGLKEAFIINMNMYKYSKHILSKVVNLVLQSKIKTDYYEIEIEGKNVTINKNPVKVEDKVVKDITDSIKNQVEYVINTVKNKLDKLG
jgi:hypothetical protein